MRKKIKGKFNKNAKKQKKLLLCVLIPAFLVIISISSYFIYININGEAKYLKIKLNDKKIVNVEYGSKYKDLGVKALYKDNDISSDVETKNNINYKKLGKYTYTYTIKYKHQTKKITRVINVVDTTKPVLELNGGEETIYVGSDYTDKGAKATDNYDGDLTDKIEVSGTVNKDTIGTYIITYKVVDSSNNEATIERKVNVVAKPAPNQKVAVLNYHFFYESWDNEPCHEVICEKMSTFREQL